MSRTCCHPAITLALLLLALAVLNAGCGHDEDPAAGLGTYSHLDPPELGTLGFADPADGVPVLCYHYFRSGFDPGYLTKVLGSVILGMPALGPREFWTTPVGEFAKHLRYFQETGTAVLTLDEVADILARGEPLPERAVVLTVDDADESFYAHAFPLLREYGMKAHLFVPTAHVGTDWSGLKVCTWEQLKEMSDSGLVLIESHTRDLHYKVRSADGMTPAFLDPAQISAERRTRGLQVLSERLRGTTGYSLSGELEVDLAGPYAPVAADLVTARLDILRGVGRRPTWLSWPYGFASPALDSLSARAGYRGTVSLAPMAFGAEDTTLQAGRFALTAKSTLKDIRAIVPTD